MNHRPVALKLRTGFTLAEMLVVLVILSVLAFVAVEALRPVASQARYDATRTTLDNVRRAIVGQSSAETSAGLRGFVADMGRFPVSLVELVQLPADQAPLSPADPTFSLRSAPGYPGVLVPAGWRGPYLLPPPGVNAAAWLPQDGWGEPLAFASSGGVATIGSVASDSRVEASPEYSAHLEIAIPESDWRPALVAGSLYRLDASVRAPPTLTGTWGVAVLGPGALTGSTAVPGGVQVVSATVQTASSGEVTYSLVGGAGGQLTAGPRVLVATLNGALVGRPVYVHLLGGGTHVVDLQVQ